MSFPGLLRAGQDCGVPVEREGSLLASCCADREKGSEAVSPVAIVWPCPLGVDAYVAVGRDVEFPRMDCPSCAEPMGLWSGYWRYASASSSRRPSIPAGSSTCVARHPARLHRPRRRPPATFLPASSSPVA